MECNTKNRIIEFLIFFLNIQVYKTRIFHWKDIFSHSINSKKKENCCFLFLFISFFHVTRAFTALVLTHRVYCLFSRCVVCYTQQWCCLCIGLARITTSLLQYFIYIFFHSSIYILFQIEEQRTYTIANQTQLKIFLCLRFIYRKFNDIMNKKKRIKTKRILFLSPFRVHCWCIGRNLVL